MAVTDVQVTCDGASGSAAPFVVMIRANGQELTQEQVTGQPVPRTGGEPWSWSFDWSFEGHQEVTIFDVTNDGAVTHLVGYFPVDCPLPSTVPETTTTVPEATAPTTTAAPEPTVTVALEPDTTAATTVVLNTAPVPHQEPTTTFVFPEDFYSAEPSTTTAPWGPCFDDGTCLPGYTPLATTTTGPVGCCSEYVGDTTATTLQIPTTPLPATGPSSLALPMLGLGAVLVMCGLLSLRLRRA